jgi:hypothetical protein
MYFLRRSRRFRKIISANFVIFVFFVVRWIFLIERDYLRTLVRNICASFANYELLQYTLFPRLRWEKEVRLSANSCNRNSDYLSQRR